MKILRRVLLFLIMFLVVLVVAIWWHLLDGLCVSPSVPNFSTRNTIPYNCHGSIVYLSPVQNVLLDWLIPILFMLIAAGHFVRKWKPRA